MRALGRRALTVALSLALRLCVACAQNRLAVTLRGEHECVAADRVEALVLSYSADTSRLISGEVVVDVRREGALWAASVSMPARNADPPRALRSSHCATLTRAVAHVVTQMLPLSTPGEPLSMQTHVVEPYRTARAVLLPPPVQPHSMLRPLDGVRWSIGLASRGELAVDPLDGAVGGAVSLHARRRDWSVVAEIEGAWSPRRSDSPTVSFDRASFTVATLFCGLFLERRVELCARAELRSLYLRSLNFSVASALAPRGALGARLAWVQPLSVRLSVFAALALSVSVLRPEFGLVQLGAPSWITLLADSSASCALAVGARVDL